MSRPLVLPQKKLINLTEEMLARIADFRFEKRINSESEAIRQLIELGLEISGYGLKPDSGEAGE
jgi:metal-responsive CopG/Arc/MetJ family transcriptional regulator